MSLTSYRAAPPRAGAGPALRGARPVGLSEIVVRECHACVVLLFAGLAATDSPVP